MVREYTKVELPGVTPDSGVERQAVEHLPHGHPVG